MSSNILRYKTYVDDKNRSAKGQTFTWEVGVRLASEAIQLGRSHRDLTVANYIELHRALDLLRIRSVSFALIASLGCLAERSLGIPAARPTYQY
jgi:hypothetical protein